MREESSARRDVAKIDELFKASVDERPARTPSVTSGGRRRNSRLDSSVLRQLPSSIRREVRLCVEPGPWVRVDDGRPLFAVTTCGFDRVAQALVLWMYRAKEPGLGHAVLLVELLAVLVASGKLDDAACVLRRVETDDTDILEVQHDRRLVEDLSRHDLDCWRPVFKLTHDVTQHMVGERTGGKRLVFRRCDDDDDDDHPAATAVSYYLDR